ncbi:MAG: hypothetical protein PWR04_837 [Anaerophaga sp.]|nr:hypothetical protein [Anaerophaga sp.]
MKIKNLLLGLLALALMTGCNDDDNNSEEFSDLTVEQHKANIEQIGIDVLHQLDDLRDMNAIHVAVDFMELADTTYESTAMTVMGPLAALQDGVDAVFTLKTTVSLADLYPDDVGIYTYNPETNKWDKEESTDEITYHFPTKDSETNNATISVTKFDSFVVTNPDIIQEVEYLPKSVTVSLVVDDKELMKFNFNATYDDNDIPLSVTENYFIGKYEITTSVERSTSKISFDQSFTYDGDNIISSHFDSDGTFNYDTYYEDFNSEEEFPGSQTLVDASNVWVVVGNLKLQGVANWEGLRNAEGQFEDVETEKAFYEEMANVMNDNVKMYVKYNDKNEIIAASEFYALERSDEYGSYWDFSMRMKFSDGSYMDESFFTEENFPGFFQEAEKFISDIETNYGLTLQ